jgi:hypothetical protein
MSEAIAALAVAFAAFCIWLTVRIVNRRERWAKRTAAAVILVGLVGYPLSTGPAGWMRANGWIGPDTDRSLHRFYSPLKWQFRNSPEPIRRAIRRYESLWRR